MDCKFNKYIDDYLEGKLDEKQEEDLREHSKECMECAKKLKEIDNADNEIAKELSEYPYKSSKGKIMERVEKKKYNVSAASTIYSFRKLGYAAAIIFVLAVSVFLLKPILNGHKMDKEVVNNTQGFEIYLVKPESVDKALSFGHYDRNNGSKYIEGNKVDLNSLVLEEKPIITDKDIFLYHWNDHEIEFTKDFLEKHQLSKEDKEMLRSDRIEGFISSTYDGSKILNTKHTDAFVIVVNGKRIYSGGFALSAIISASPAEIGISDTPNNTIKIWNSRVSSDIRTDKAIYYFFKQQGKLVGYDNVSEESKAIQVVKNHYDYFYDYPDKQGKIDATIWAGGPAPGIKMTGQLETKVEKDKDGNYTVTFIKHWNPIKTESLQHFWTYKIGSGNVSLINEGGPMDPNQIK